MYRTSEQRIIDDYEASEREEMDAIVSAFYDAADLLPCPSCVGGTLRIDGRICVIFCDSCGLRVQKLVRTIALSIFATFHTSGTTQDSIFLLRKSCQLY